MPLLHRLRPLSWRTACLVGLACLCALVLLGEAGALLYLRLNEDELVFHTAQSRLRPDGELPPEAERVTIRAQDGAALAAFVLRPPVAQDSGYWILHLHGNAVSAFAAEQIRHCAQLQQLGFGVLCFDYRGFGRSGGRATEAHLDQDAESALQALIDRGIAPSHIVVLGHSLGSGPAVLLARAHGLATLVLFGAFTSVPDVAQQLYPYLPVRFIAGIHFDSIDRIGQVHVPVLIVHALGDTLIPVEHARRLYAAANAPKRLLLLEGSFHDGFGGHVDALYDQADQLPPPLAALIGVPLSAH